MRRLAAALCLALLCGLAATLGAGGQLQSTSVDSQTVLSRQVTVLRQQCLLSARDAALADLSRREDQEQHEWCDATRAARRVEFGAAFVESVRRAKGGGNGLAKTLAEFLRNNPDAIKPLAVSSPSCTDEKLRIDEALVVPVVDHPSLVGTIFGVNLHGKQVSRINPVPRWERLLKEGMVLRSPQIAYKTPLPVVSQVEKAAAIQTVQTRACPSQVELDSALATQTAEAAPVRDAAAAQMDAADFVAAILADSNQRKRLGPMMQLAQASARLPGLSASCDRDLRALLTDDELARRITVELVRLVNARSLQRILDIRRSLGTTQLFSADGQLRLIHPEDEREQARIAVMYGNESRAEFVVDAADVTAAANQAVALGLYGWSSARSDIIARGCAPGRR